jgi:hypothetical protein
MTPLPFPRIARNDKGKCDDRVSLTHTPDLVASPWKDDCFSFVGVSEKCRRWKQDDLVTEGLESLGCLAVDLGVLLRLGQLALGQLFALVVSSTLRLAALL